MVSVQFRFEGQWYVAVSVEGKPRKLARVFKLMNSRALELGYFSKLRRAAKSALESF